MFKDYRAGRAAGKSRTCCRHTRPPCHSRMLERLSDFPTGRCDSAGTGAPRCTWWICHGVRERREAVDNQTQSTSRPQSSAFWVLSEMGAQPLLASMASLCLLIDRVSWMAERFCRFRELDKFLMCFVNQDSNVGFRLHADINRSKTVALMCWEEFWLKVN